MTHASFFFRRDGPPDLLLAIRRDPEVARVVGGALIEFLREQGSAETLKQLLYEQTYAKLIELYGETLVRDFEQQIRFTDGDKD